MTSHDLQAVHKMKFKAAGMFAKNLKSAKKEKGKYNTKNDSLMALQ